MGEQTFEVCFKHFQNFFLYVFWHYCLHFELAAFPWQAQVNNDKMAHLMNHDRVFLKKNDPSSNGGPFFVCIECDGWWEPDVPFSHVWPQCTFQKLSSRWRQIMEFLFCIDPEIFYIIFTGSWKWISKEIIHLRFRLFMCVDHVKNYRVSFFSRLWKK